MTTEDTSVISAFLDSLCHLEPWTLHRYHCFLLTYVDGCLLLVPRQHPDLDVCPHQSGDGLWNASLETVLDGSGSQKQQVLMMIKVETDPNICLHHHPHLNEEPGDSQTVRVRPCADTAPITFLSFCFNLFNI